jgi:putative transposase
VILAHKIALDPTQAQAEHFARACGVARFAWNWGLARWGQEYALWREYRCGPKPSEAALRRELNALKADAFPWMREVTKNAPQQATKNLGTAFKNFFEGRARYPTFKKKGRANDSFRADNGTDKDHPNAVEVDGRRVKLPVIGWVRMREAPRFQGPIKSATVSRVADRWFVSLSVEVDHAPPARENQAVGGVDLGVKAMATLSDGGVIAGPKALRRNLKKLRRLGRALSRKAKGSANRGKAAARLARLHARIADVRRDALHKATTEIVRRFGVVGIEDLNVRGMMANGRLARAIADVGVFEFRRRLDYKAPMHGSRVVVAGRWFPSSRLCSDCGHIHGGLTLADREWACDGCGVVHDRDLNAAINLRSVAESSLAAASPSGRPGGSVTACGAEGSGLGLAAKAKPAAMKQEPTPGTVVHG